MLCNSASGPEIGLPGRISAGLEPGYLDSDVRQVAELMLFILLNNQLVEWNGRFCHVCVGSSMGLMHSGGLSDLAFNKVVETKIDKESWGLLGYFRFKDDIFATGQNPCGC